MGQTNIQVPIEQRPDQHNKEVQEKRKILLGAARYRNPGPSALGQDDKHMPLLVYHTSVTNQPRDASEAPDLIYGERMGGHHAG